MSSNHGYFSFIETDNMSPWVFNDAQSTITLLTKTGEVVIDNAKRIDYGLMQDSRYDTLSVFHVGYRHAPGLLTVSAGNEVSQSEFDRLSAEQETIEVNRHV